MIRSSLIFIDNVGNLFISLLDGNLYSSKKKLCYEYVIVQRIKEGQLKIFSFDKILIRWYFFIRFFFNYFLFYPSFYSFYSSISSLFISLITNTTCLKKSLKRHTSQFHNFFLSQLSFNYSIIIFKLWLSSTKILTRHVLQRNVLKTEFLRRYVMGSDYRLTKCPTIVRSQRASIDWT